MRARPRSGCESEGFHSLRLVTASYHMPRSMLEFARAMPDIAIVPNPVFPEFMRESAVVAIAPQRGAGRQRIQQISRGAGAALRAGRAAAVGSERLIFLRSLLFQILFYTWTAALRLPRRAVHAARRRCG